MNTNPAAMLVAILAMAFMNIGQAVQKLGHDRWHTGKRAGLPLWGSGILMTTTSSFVTMWAVSLGEVSLVGAMAGTGLPFMVLFSMLVLREPAGPIRQYLGIVVILVSAIFIGLFKNSSPAPVVYPLRVWLLLLISTGGFILTIMFSALKDGRVSGFWLSALAGSLRGFVPLFRKLAVSRVGSDTSPDWRWLEGLPSWMVNPARALMNPYTLIWMIVVTGSMIVFQFAHRLDTAMRNIPSFTVAFVLLPVIGGTICFGEGLSPVLIGGVAGILAGNIMVTRQIPEVAPENASPPNHSAGEC